MLKEIFLPEKIGSRRIYAQRIVGIAYNDYSIELAVLHAKRSTTIIERLISQPIDQSTQESVEARTSLALKTAIASIKSYDQICIAIPSSIVIFKELQLPFIETEKIRLVLEYEIEGMLPFSVQEAIIDFIITKKNTAEKTAQILVAAVRSSDLQHHLALYQEAGIAPNCITIDLFAHYSLYQQIADYAHPEDSTVLVDINDTTTRVAFVQNGQLRLTRSVPRGIQTIIKLVHEETQIPISQIHTTLLEQGITTTDTPLDRSLHHHFTILLNEIQFTLNSFSIKLRFYENIARILLTEQHFIIKDFGQFCQDTLQIPCEYFDSRKLLANAAIKNKTSESFEYNPYLTALAAAISLSQQSDFNLRRKQYAFTQEGLVIKQLITAAICTIALLLLIGVNGFFYIKELKNQASSFEQQEIEKIKSEGLITESAIKKIQGLKNIIKSVEKKFAEEAETWAPFEKNRISPLTIWLEVTRILNKKNFDVIVTKMSIAHNLSGSLGVELEGLFKSKTGNHFVDFLDLEKRFKESSLLKIGDQSEDTIDTSPAPEGGVRFSAKLRLKDQ